ncbi:hypothetical protein LguiA_005455 [Lonicera macranthoides]
MYLRQVTGGLLRRRLQLGCRSLQTVVASSTNSLAGGTTTNTTLPIAGKTIFSNQYGSGGHTWSEQHGDVFPWIFLCGPAVLFLGINACPVLAEDVSIELNSENDTTGANVTGLPKIEDGSVVSNLHTSKWRSFTDKGRELFLQGKLEDSEQLFLAALKEAKEGFGERDLHVASACNNLAELYRSKKTFDKAELLYLEQISILETAVVPDAIRVGTALHNLGEVYLMQEKLEEARASFEIRRGILGKNHIDCADTIYYLGTVLYIQGEEGESEDLIKDSIRILQESGQGESTICATRLQHLSQIYNKSNRLAEAETLRRKILHIMESSKGWNCMETVIAAQRLAQTLHSVGSLREEKELLIRCVDSQKTFLSADDFQWQVAMNMMDIGLVEILISTELRETNISKAIAELDSAKDHLGNAMRMFRKDLDELMRQNWRMYINSRETRKELQPQLLKVFNVVLKSLLQSFLALAMVDINKGSTEQDGVLGVEDCAHQSISAFKKYSSKRWLTPSSEVKAYYLKCLKHFLKLLKSRTTTKATLQELEDEVRRIEGELLTTN